MFPNYSSRSILKNTGRIPSVQQAMMKLPGSRKNFPSNERCNTSLKMSCQAQLHGQFVGMDNPSVSKTSPTSNRGQRSSVFEAGNSSPHSSFTPSFFRTVILTLLRTTIRLTTRLFLRRNQNIYVPTLLLSSKNLQVQFFITYEVTECSSRVNEYSSPSLWR
jgi:hypothetical protein